MGKGAVEVGPLASGGESSKEKLEQGHALGKTGPPGHFTRALCEQLVSVAGNSEGKHRGNTEGKSEASLPTLICGSVVWDLGHISAPL